jgi:hypothetical protein
MLVFEAQWPEKMLGSIGLDVLTGSLLENVAKQLRHPAAVRKECSRLVRHRPVNCKPHHRFTYRFRWANNVVRLPHLSICMHTHLASPV